MKLRKDMWIEYWAYINASGYSNASKHYIKILKDLGYNIWIHPISPKVFLDNRSTLDQEISQILESQKNNQRPQIDMKFVQAVPPMGTDALEKEPNIPVVWLYAWEGKYLPSELIEILPKAKHVVTFSNIQADIYRSQIKKNNITVVPHVVMNQALYDPKLAQPRKLQDVFTFLSIFEWNARKDPITLLKAYMHAFSAEDKVALILKTISVSPDTLNKEIGNVVRGMRLRHSVPKIVPVFGYLADEDLHNLYKTSDVYVTSCRGEGFGLPLIEALFCGLPVIYPNMYIDHDPFNTTNSIQVEATETLMYNSQFDINRGDNIWGQCSDVDLANKMRLAYDKRDSLFGNPVYPDPKFVLEYNNIAKTFDDMIQNLSI